MLPNLIPIDDVMVHYFLNIRRAVHPSDDVCKSDGEACARYVLKTFVKRDNTIKNVYL